MTNRISKWYTKGTSDVIGKIFKVIRRTKKITFPQKCSIYGRFFINFKNAFFQSWFSIQSQNTVGLWRWQSFILLLLHRKKYFNSNRLTKSCILIRLHFSAVTAFSNKFTVSLVKYDTKSEMFCIKAIYTTNTINSISKKKTFQISNSYS